MNGNFRELINDDMLDVEMTLILDLMKRRMIKHGAGGFVTSHEAMGVVLEEVLEMQQAVQQNAMGDFYLELGDIAVACIFARASIRNTHMGDSARVYGI